MGKLFLMIIRRFSLLALVFFYTIPLFAQDRPEMADVMRSNGKIYVVVAVCLMILVGLFLYMLRLDRKMTRMERENKVD